MLHYYQIVALCVLEAILIAILLRERRGRRLGQQRLEERMRFEQLVAELSGTFISLPTDRFESAIVDALGRVARLLKFDIAAMSVFTGPGARGRVAYIWRADEVPDIPPDLSDVEFPWVAQELFAGRDVSVRTLEELPPQARIDRATYQKLHIRSSFNVPMVAGGKVIGVLGLCTVWEERELSRELIQGHRLLGEVFANALARIRAEMELQEQRQQLAHMGRVSTMSELATSLAHELNQPLTATLSNAQAAQRFLQTKPADLRELKEILQDIVNDTARAGEVISHMRALAKKEAFNMMLLDIAGVIHDVMLLIQNDAALHNVRVSLELEPDLPPVRGNKVQLQQVLLNLLLNAFDAMSCLSESEREVTLRAVSNGRGVLEVAVQDRGSGVPGGSVERVFEPFYTTKRDGLGMGLSICRSIIDAHGGSLWAKNNSARGATFYFSLPAAESRDVASSRSASV